MSSVQGKLSWLYRAVLLTHKISTCDLACDYPQDLRLQLSHPPLLSCTAFTACYLHSQATGLYSGPGWEKPGPASGLFTCSPCLTWLPPKVILQITTNEFFLHTNTSLLATNLLNPHWMRLQHVLFASTLYRVLHFHSIQLGPLPRMPVPSSVWQTLQNVLPLPTF